MEVNCEYAIVVWLKAFCGYRTNVSSIFFVGNIQGLMIQRIVIDKLFVFLMYCGNFILFPAPQM